MKNKPEKQRIKTSLKELRKLAKISDGMLGFNNVRMPFRFVKVEKNNILVEVYKHKRGSDVAGWIARQLKPQKFKSYLRPKNCWINQTCKLRMEYEGVSYI